jgi:fructose-bisphosphate aldolase class I
MNTEELVATANAMVADGKGVLAADESTGTITKRFGTHGIDSTPDNRRDYRQTLLTTPGLGEFIGGVILFDETIRQSSSDGTPLVDVIRDQGIIPGIKVDTGAKELAGSPSEKVTEGLDGLRERITEYYEIGARFAKWRAVITIGDGIPTPYCIDANAHALARYARLCQEGGLVPIVEPEVLMDGGHDIGRADEVTTASLHTVFHALFEQGVFLEGMLLKPSMVMSGADCAGQADVDEVAARTVRCLRRTVPSAVPGIVFLSGGQSREVATAHLNAMNADHGPHPWKLSFSYGRALQDLALELWSGSNDNVAAAQDALFTRAKANGEASRGSFAGEAA